MGVRKVAVASTGNKAASVAAFAARAGVGCQVFVPKGTSQRKVAQASSYGADIVSVPGEYDDALRACEEQGGRQDSLVLGNYSHRLEGQKTLAFELARQALPDVLLVPSGSGALVTALWKGFREFLELGLIGKIPRLVVVQTTAHPAIAQTLGPSGPVPGVDRKTVASAIAVRDPAFRATAAAAVRDTHGIALTVCDPEILDAQLFLSSTEGIWVEPSAAAALAGLAKGLGDGRLSRQQSFCVVATGNGLKDPASVLERVHRGPIEHLTVNSTDRAASSTDSDLALVAPSARGAR